MKKPDGSEYTMEDLQPMYIPNFPNSPIFVPKDFVTCYTTGNILKEYDPCQPTPLKPTSKAQ